MWPAQTPQLHSHHSHRFDSFYSEASSTPHFYGRETMTSVLFRKGIQIFNIIFKYMPTWKMFYLYKKILRYNYKYYESSKHIQAFHSFNLQWFHLCMRSCLFVFLQQRQISSCVWSLKYNRSDPECNSPHPNRLKTQVQQQGWDSNPRVQRTID